MPLPTKEQYDVFLEDKILGFNLAKLENYYSSVTSLMKQKFEESLFIQRLNEKLADYDAEFLNETGYKLFSRREPIRINVKKFGSMLEKCYRFDVIYNKHWEETDFSFESNYKWKNPARFFEEFNDIIRTRISVRYLDGAIKMINQLTELANSLGLKSERSYKAEEDGYYAVHFLVSYPFSISDMDFKTINVNVLVEFQITTEIQELINDLTRQYYERRRVKVKNTDEKWQWDYDCDEFVPNYLGHIIHYIEGMIMEVREKK